MLKRESLIVKKQGLKGKSIRILQISDVHSKEGDEKLFVWDKIEKLSFDIAVITGDLIANRHTQILPHMPYLKRLTEKVPVFYVFGNHEKYDETEVRELLESAGVTVLEDENARLSISGGDVNIVGLRDYYSIQSHGRGNIPEFLKQLNPNEFNIVLSHQPQIFKYVASFDTDLMLSGHTHGGQVRIPFFPTLYAPGQGFFPEYGDGWYHINKSSLYVSKGVGATVFPVRLFNRAEIAVIEVKFD